MKEKSKEITEIKMNEDLKNEIEEAKALGRNQRKKKERELQKKYNDKNIRIFSNKTFKKTENFNRQEKRELTKDKNLIKEIVRIIKKYFPLLDNLILNLTDKRNKSYITYNLKSIIYTKLFALLCGITNMVDISKTSIFDTKNTINCISQLAGQNLEEIPYWQTIQDVIEQLEEKEIIEIRKYMIKTLIKSKMFYSKRYNGYWQLLVDATGLSSHDYNLNGNCTSKKNKNGNIKYYKYVLEAKIVVGNIVLSLDSEWIENCDILNESQKQDCELNAWKRMAKRIYKNYPKLKFLVTGDALYATAPNIKLCEDYGWKYIFNLKKDRLKNLYDDFQDNLNYKNETNKKGYFLSTNIEYKSSHLNCVRYETERKNTKTKEMEKVTFNYITNLDVSNTNIETIVALGRARWKIENEGFNMQKNGTFNISHVCSRNKNGIKIHYYLIQIAHILRQLLENGSNIYKSLRLGTKKEATIILFNDIAQNHTNLREINLSFQLRFSD